ncbi:MAG: hypothetical protein OJF51_003798 [Nitrospira sp.]|nr:MAG: hypothetical protein OJF51_003798 [Nitrospira sp.]
MVQGHIVSSVGNPHARRVLDRVWIRLAKRHMKRHMTYNVFLEEL